MLSLGEMQVVITADHTKLDKEVNTTSSSIKDKLGGAAKAAKVALVAAAAAAAAAVVSLGKQSLEAYAQYEQLTGGVETLFKESSDKVVEYAENAYKTAGISANEYMEQATSFSASLLQSLGGDTEKAADYADMAITDMADNCNKFGSDLESVQNAYAGFSKQNFTMLDNLKLGYSGTKEEMQRLLDDAEKLSGVEYDISSYADIVDAIHVVQTEMGIAGTTAEEAEQTIEGSISMTKAAYQNLVAGLADENADVQGLLEQLVSSAVTAANNILPRVKTFLVSIGTLIYNNRDRIMNAAFSLFKKFADGLIKAIPVIIGKLPNLIGSLVKSMLRYIPEIITVGVRLIKALGQGVVNAWGSFTSMIGSKIKSWFSWETILSLFGKSDSSGTKHRIGLSEVPYDGYQAILHKGERILTAAEANHVDKMSAGSGNNVTINFNGSYSFGSKSDIDYFMKESQKLINRRAVTV